MSDLTFWILASGIVLVLLAIAFVVVVIVAFQTAVRKRRAEMASLAARLGLDFRPARDFQLPRQFRFLNRLREGSIGSALNVMAGVRQQQRVMIFEHESNGTEPDIRQLWCFVLFLPRFCPEVTIVPESFLSRLGGAIGFEGIHFESADFSRAFCVQSADKRFAYDICNPRMMDYLVANRDLNIEIERGVLAVCLDGPLSSPQIEYNLARLLAVRSFIPEYLLTKA